MRRLLLLVLTSCSLPNLGAIRLSDCRASAARVDVRDRRTALRSRRRAQSGKGGSGEVQRRAAAEGDVTLTIQRRDAYARRY
jgi:hypothetical protein